MKVLFAQFFTLLFFCLFFCSKNFERERICEEKQHLHKFIKKLCWFWRRLFLRHFASPGILRNRTNLDRNNFKLFFGKKCELPHPNLHMKSGQFTCIYGCGKENVNVNSVSQQTWPMKCSQIITINFKLTDINN